jgi:hypothetical protein
MFNMVVTDYAWITGDSFHRLHPGLTLGKCRTECDVMMLHKKPHHHETKRRKTA